MQINYVLRCWIIVASIVLRSVGAASATDLQGTVIKGPVVKDQADLVNEYVQAEMHRQHLPGLALLVSRAGQVVRAQGYGLANVELQVPVKPETIFQSGSVGKQFTATAVMILVEEGKIGLEDPLIKYFPDAPPPSKHTTILHLLSH